MMSCDRFDGPSAATLSSVVPASPRRRLLAMPSVEGQGAATAARGPEIEVYAVASDASEPSPSKRAD